MERKLSISIYVCAFLASLAIFLVGIYIGSLFDSSNLGSISSDVSSISEKVASVQLLLLTEGNSSSVCPLYLSELNSIDSEVERVGYKLSYLEDERGIFDSELKKKYFILEAESYLLSKKVRDMCGDKSILLIHFYSNKNCSACLDQGSEVLKARDRVIQRNNSDVKLFSFDGDLGSPVVETFKSRYNITSYPSLVINEKTYPGYRSSSEIESIVLAAR